MSLAIQRRQFHQRVKGSGHAIDYAFTRRLGVIAAAATFLMLMAMTIGTTLGARAILSSQSEQRFADKVSGASNTVRADLDRSSVITGAILIISGRVPMLASIFGRSVR